MNRTPEDEIDPDWERAFDRDCKNLPQPAARGAFRAALRERFISNSELQQSQSIEPRPLARSRAGAHARLGWTAAAAALVLGIAWWAWTGPGERVERLAGDVDPAALDAFTRGAVLRTHASSVVLRLDDVIVVEIAADSEVTLAERFDEHGQGLARFVIRAGALRVVTAAEFPPRRLVVETPDASLEVVGTEFGIDIFEAAATCICCTHGAVAVTTPGQAPHRVEAGGMAWCPVGGAMPMYGEAKADHVAPIVALRRYWTP